METDELIERFRQEVPAYYIQKSDMKRLGDMVGGTFADDGAIRYLLGDISDRARSRYCRTTYRSMFGDAVMLSTDARLDNLIVLCPPGYGGIPTLRFLRSGGIGTVFSVGLGAIRRSIAFEENAVAVRNRFSDDKTWYLMTFAVRYGKTHHGLGSEIMYPVLEWMDKNGYALYLETHKTVNVEMYEHYGFQLMDTCTVPGSQILQYGMVRPAK